MKKERKGIAIAGSIILDQVKKVDLYPPRLMLTSIKELSRAVGGCVSNTAIDLATIDPTLPVKAIGKVGRDEGGRYIIETLKAHVVDADLVTACDDATSFSDVMSEISTGARTFLHYRGANARFSRDDVDLSSLDCRMLHAGYLLLLDQFDRENDEYGTEMARFLHDAQKEGIRTSIDAVSESSGVFREKVLPVLRYTDNVILNEIEGCGAAGLDARDENDVLIEANVYRAMEYMMKKGVGERVVIHCPEAGFALNKDGTFTRVPSLSLPKGFIRGSVGAGDAFCAGCLYGIYTGMSDSEMLAFASGAAACNLSAVDSISGMKSRTEIEALVASMPKRP